MSDDKGKAIFLCSGDHGYCDWIDCPYGKPGDLLYVREMWKPLGQDSSDGEWTIEFKTGEKLNMGRLWPKEEEHKEIDLSERLAKEYEQKGYMTWKPSLFMPKGASRIWLKVKDVRVERVQDIPTEDISKEGAVHEKATPWEAIDAWVELWDSINAKRDEGQFAWKENPWVWVVLFDVLSTKGKS